MGETAGHLEYSDALRRCRRLNARSRHRNNVSGVHRAVVVDAKRMSDLSRNSRSFRIRTESIQEWPKYTEDEVFSNWVCADSIGASTWLSTVLEDR